MFEGIFGRKEKSEAETERTWPCICWCGCDTEINRVGQCDDCEATKHRGL